MLFRNIEGLFPHCKRHKIALLKEQAIDKGIDIIASVESHLREEIRDVETNMIRFHTIRTERLEGIRKCGVIVYLRNDIAEEARVLSSGSDDTIE